MTFGHEKRSSVHKVMKTFRSKRRINIFFLVPTDLRRKYDYSKEIPELLLIKLCIQGGRRVLHQKNFTGRAGCREQCEVGFPCPEMNSNAATQAIQRHSYYVCFGSDGSCYFRLCLVAQWVSTRYAEQKVQGSSLV